MYTIEQKVVDKTADQFGIGEVVNVEKTYSHGEWKTMLTVNFGPSPDADEDEREDRIFDRLPQEVEMFNGEVTEKSCD